MHVEHTLNMLTMHADCLAHAYYIVVAVTAATWTLCFALVVAVGLSRLRCCEWRLAAADVSAHRPLCV